MTEDDITKLTIDVSQRYLFIKSTNDSFSTLTVKVVADLVDGPLLQFIVLKTKLTTFFDVGNIFNNRLYPFSRINPKTNASTMSQIKASMELLNFTPFMRYFNRLELEVEDLFNDDRLSFGQWTYRNFPEEVEKYPVGITTAYLDFILLIPERYDFLFSHNKVEEPRMVHNGQTLIFFPSNEHYLDFSEFGVVQLIDSGLKAPFHICLKNYEIQPNLFLPDSSQGYNDLLGIISLGTFDLPMDDMHRTTNEKENFIVPLPFNGLNQSLEIKIIDSNLTPVEILPPSYIIIKLNISSL